MVIIVTEAFKRHVPDWETHVHHPELGGERVWSEYGEGWLDGYDCAEADAKAGGLVLTAVEATIVDEVIEDYMMLADVAEDDEDGVNLVAIRAKLRNALGREG